MDSSLFVALAGLGLFGMLVLAVVGVLLAALLLCAAFRLVLGYMPSYLRAVGVVVLVWIAGWATMLLVAKFWPGGAAGPLSLLLQFVVGAALVNRQLLARNGSRIGYAKAGMVQLIYLVVFVALALAVDFVMATFAAA